jgi:hypothetical protein
MDLDEDLVAVRNGPLDVDDVKGLLGRTVAILDDCFHPTTLGRHPECLRRTE